MAKPKTPASRKVMTDAEVERHMAEWKEQRYGKGFKRLAPDQIAKIASTLVNGDTDAAELLVLLADELERVLEGEYGKIDVNCIFITMRDAVMPYTGDFSNFAQCVADRRRKELTGPAR